MATLPRSGAVTLLDVANAHTSDGKAAKIAELLTQTNEILYDLHMVEANEFTSHRSVIRSGLPTAVFRQLYKGVPESKGELIQVTDTIGSLEARSIIDEDILNMSKTPDEFILSQSRPFLEAMNQTMAQTMFYGDVTVNKERFNGLLARYNSLSGNISQNVISAGGSGSDNTSIWLAVHGESTFHGIYPLNSGGGLTHSDLGIQDAFDSSNNRYRAKMDLWRWKMGICVPDWRYVVRICNIDVSDMLALSTTQATTASTFLLKLMAKAMARIPSLGMGRPVFYANRTVKEMLSIMAMEKASSVLAIESGLNQFGKVEPGSVNNGTLTFQGIPVRTVDQILLTETAVS